MAVNFDKWTLLKLFELGFAIACLVCHRVTDDEASRLFLYLQKLSREWSLLNNVTWGRIGAALAFAVYGGYIIITFALFFGRLFRELPTQRRITEFILLGTGAILYIVLGSLEFAALDSVPPDLVDNAAIIGTLSLITAALFLLDMGGPKAKKPLSSQVSQKAVQTPSEKQSVSHQLYRVEKEGPQTVPLEELPQYETKSPKQYRNGGVIRRDIEKDDRFRKVLEDKPKRFGIYGKDVGDSDTDEIDDVIPPKMEQQSPVWSNIRKVGQYGRYGSELISSSFLYPKEVEDDRRPPSNPLDPGYVQYTVQHWGSGGPKTPRQSPTQV